MTNNRVTLSNIDRAHIENAGLDIKETTNLLRAALFIVQAGEATDLEREEIAALAAVIKQAHTTASTLADEWQAIVGQEG